jgi:YidC/Oxa1 family membrane protein insertase
MDNKNLLIAILLSVGILVGYQYYYVKPQQEHYREQVKVEAEKRAQEVKPETAADNAVPRARDAVIAENQRIKIATPNLEGSINLKGASLDDLSLVNYRENTDANAPAITLLSPVGSAAPHSAYYAEFSWLSGDTATSVPTAQTVWKTNGNALTPSSPVTLTWDNGRGLVFERTIAVDDHFMFTITDNVRNSGSGSATLYPFGYIRRQGNPVTRDIFVLHEGPIGVLNGTLEEYKYKDLISAGKKPADSDGGWLGITDKYWLVALIPPQNEKLTTEFAYTAGNAINVGDGYFQTDFRGAAMTIAPGASISHATQFFAGAKLLRLLDYYEEQYKIPHFDRAIDFGWFYFLTKPFLYLLDMLGSVLGNFGLAILAFTVMLKIVTLPLSIKSYRAMAKMKALQPELKKLQERNADDRRNWAPR